MSDASHYQLNEICEIADEAVQWVIQSEFKATEKEANVMIENREKFQDAIRDAARKFLLETFGHSTK